MGEGMDFYFDRHYGLTGRTVRVRKRRNASEAMEARGKASGIDPYPWEGITVPVRVLAEYPTYLLCEVLCHIGPRGFPITDTYRITIDKHDIYKGEMVINEGRIR